MRIVELKLLIRILTPQFSSISRSALLKQIGEFKKRCFDKALREIDENCGVKITYKNIKKGRVIVGFHCFAVSTYHIDENKIPQLTKEKVRRRKLELEQCYRKLTSDEQEEYEQLITNVDQIELKLID
jgi:plasmid replication initiation protein